LEGVAILVFIPTEPILDKRKALAAQVGRSARTARILAFWKWFATNERDLRRIRGVRDSVCDALLHALQRIDAHLCFEIRPHATSCELIVAVEGPQELLPLVDAIIAAAPPMPGWTFLTWKLPQTPQRRRRKGVGVVD